MIEKHLKRIKKAESGIPTEDEWEEIPSLGEKIEDQIIEEVPDRSVRVARYHKTNLDAYEEDSPKLKDDFHNAAQYSELVKGFVKEKKTDFEQFKKDRVRFDKEVSNLKPRKPELKFDLKKLNYKEIKVSKLKNELGKLEFERDEIKSNLKHFKNQIENSETELSFKVEQIDDIKSELRRLEKKEALQKTIKTEKEAIDVIKKELSLIGDVEESNKIFRRVNTLVELLNSKNEATQKELNSVKAEFSELQKKYIDLMNKLK